jgi:hypothetical protein
VVNGGPSAACWRFVVECAVPDRYTTANDEETRVEAKNNMALAAGACTSNRGIGHGIWVFNLKMFALAFLN